MPRLTEIHRSWFKLSMQDKVNLINEVRKNRLIVRDAIIKEKIKKTKKASTRKKKSDLDKLLAKAKNLNSSQIELLLQQIKSETKDAKS